MERVFKLRNGDSLMCTEQAAVFRFSGPRTVLSTGANCGGMRYDLRSVFNYSDCGAAGVCLPMEGKSLLEHQYAVAKRLGLDPEHTTGLDTAANLDNMAVVTKSWEDLWITAAVSGGADVNALCAGDPASLTEMDGTPVFAPPGTINIFLVAGCPLAPGAMVELVLTATEAKTAVLRDLMQGSSASPALATGTGTDGMVIICPSQGEHTLLNAGKHFKFGELAACAVKEAVSEALFRQTGLCAQTQHSVLNRLLRFGITPDVLAAQCASARSLQRPAFARSLEKLNRDSFLVGAVALYAHLIDQRSAEMLTAQEAEDWGRYLLDAIGQHYHCPLPATRGTPLTEQLTTFLCRLLLANLEEQDRLYPGETLL